MVLSKEGFLYLRERLQVNKIVHARLRCIIFATLDIGILTCMRMELVDIIGRRKLDIASSGEIGKKID